jgi:hypothetical protein
MTRMISSLAACVWVAGLLSAGAASAQSNMSQGSMSQGSMSQGTMPMQGDAMQGQMSGSQSGKDMMKKHMDAKDTTKTGKTMKTGSTRDDCHHKAGMQKDAMKKQEMMKACDSM